MWLVYGVDDYIMMFCILFALQQTAQDQLVKKKKMFLFLQSISLQKNCPKNQIGTLLVHSLMRLLVI